MKCEFEEGDRVRLDHMPNDPDPIPPGSTGTVLGITDLTEYTQITIDWDSGRTLMAIVPPDKLTKIQKDR